MSKINKGLFTSNTDLWATPVSFFKECDKRFNFNLDVCATDENAKCSNYYTKEVDGLSQSWEGRVWCNPPYGREIVHWVKKAHNTFYNNENELVVMLLPARTDTKWFHEYIYGKAKIEFIKGRLKFGDGKGSAPFPSMLVIYERGGEE